jgi:hypothetical protein
VRLNLRLNGENRAYGFLAETGNFRVYSFALDLMNTRKPHTAVRPPAGLQSILERALAGNADSVELEPVLEGLEVCWRVGNTGLGNVVSTAEGNRITRFIVPAASLERHDHGLMTMEVAGESRKISVEAYEHFGEWAYRLRLAPARKRRRT